MSKVFAIISIGFGSLIGFQVVLFIAYLVTIGWYSGNDGFNTELIIIMIVVTGGLLGFLFWKKWRLKALIVLLLIPFILTTCFLLSVLIPYID